MIASRLPLQDQPPGLLDHLLPKGLGRRFFDQREAVVLIERSGGAVAGVGPKHDLVIVRRSVPRAGTADTGRVQSARLVAMMQLKTVGGTCD